MNWIDILILSMVGLSVLIGIFRGFIREALSLVSWGLAIAGGIYFHDMASNYFSTWISNPAMRSVVGFGAVFLVILIVCSLIAHLIGFLVKKSGLGGTDRMLGVVFGFVRGVLICGVCLLVVSFSPLKNNEVWQSSTLRPYFHPLMAWLNDNVPDKLNVAKDMLDKSSSNNSEKLEHEKQHMPNLALLKAAANENHGMLMDD